MNDEFDKKLKAYVVILLIPFVISGIDKLIGFNGINIKVDTNWFTNFIVVLILSAIFTYVFISFTKSKHILVKRATHAKKYLNKESLEITKKVDRFLDSELVEKNEI